jgi:hypothetical protein
MSDDQFTKLFRYLQEFRAEFNERFEQNDRQHADMYASIAELSGEMKDTRDEVVTLSYQVGKCQTAIKEIAEATGIGLSVEL